MNIKMPLDKASISNVIFMIEYKPSEWKDKLALLSQRLAEIGVKIASVRYLYGIEEGNFDYDVRVEPTENGCKLVAEGESVCFLEFGAGVSTNGWEGEGAEGLPPIYPGSWSETEGLGQFANKGYWIHNKQLYNGLEPKMGMYYASKEMQSKAIEEARKVFKND